MAKKNDKEANDFAELDLEDESKIFDDLAYCHILYGPCPEQAEQIILYPEPLALNETEKKKKK